MHNIVKSKVKIQFKIKKYTKTIIGFGLVVVFLCVVSFENYKVSIGNNVFASDDAKKTKNEIHDLEKDMKKEQEKKQEKTQEATVIKGGIYTLSKNITNIQGQINRTESSLTKLKKDIKEKEEDIVDGKKKMASVIRQMNRQKIDLKMTILDSDKGLKAYIKSRDAMEELQRNILNNLDELKERRRELEKSKEEKDEAKDVLDSQKVGLEQEKVKKSWLLGEKNKEISVHDAKIKGIQRKIDKLNSALSSFLGKSFNAKDIVSAVKFASKRTGVRKEFLMAMLDKETDLGRFTGGCTYKKTRVRDSDKIFFKSICKSLGYNYKKKKISCSLSYGYGGAMGVAQFMPATWMGYKSRISAKTGNNPPDPWNLGDGIVAMALYLKDKGGDRKSGEYEAAARYYCGGNWRRSVCYNYANTVKSWAKGGYEEYF
jgi:predicted  nucleic acid-binding Zn-ribbon protein